MSSDPRQKFELIEASRGVAALVVVFHHIGNMVAEPRFLGLHVFGGHFQNFNVGVDFFFVLSGFIITWAHWKDVGAPNKLGDFARKRFLRIYPPYWGILLPLVIFYAAAAHAGTTNQHGALNTILSWLLLPNTVQPVLGVAWTLTYEVTFYALFGMLILMGRKALVIVPLWVAGILIAWFSDVRTFPFGFIFSPYNLEFLLGCLVAVVAKKKRVPAPGLIMMVGAGAFLGLMLFGRHIQDDPLRGRVVFGIASCLIVLGAAQYEQRTPVSIPAASALLGSSSYSLYLIHTVVLAFTLPLLWRVAPGLPGPMLVLALAALCVSVGILYHLQAERWLIGWTRRVMDTVRRRGTDAPPLRSTKEV